MTITAEVETFFARIVGFDTMPLQRTGSAEFFLPVPMGSPLNYYGIGCMDMRAAANDPLCITSGNSNSSSGVPNATTGSTAIGRTAPSQLKAMASGGCLHQGR